jgi:hypothetical protein
VIRFSAGPALAGLILAILLPTGSALGENIRIEEDTGTPGITLVSQGPSGVEIHYGMDHFAIEPVTINGENLQAISLSGVFIPNDAGAPDLPSIGKYIALPQGATASLEVVAMRTRIFHDIEVAPAPVIPRESDDSPLVYNKDLSIYEQDAYYPEHPILLSDLEEMRGVDVVILGIRPFQYNPVTKELLVFTEVTVRVDFSGGNGLFGEDRLRNRYWEPILQGHLLNYESLPSIDFNRPGGDRDGCEYMIICPDHPDFIAWGDSLKAWRKLQGISTEVFTTTDIGGTSSAQIEAFINDAYENWDPAPVAFLILGDYPGSGDKGDGLRDDGITSPMWGSCVSDNIYADIDGNDLPDMAHARITARDAVDLETMIGKLLSYEREPYTDTHFYDHPVIAGGWQSDRWFILCADICFGFQELILGKQPVREYAGGPAGGSWSSNPNTHLILDYFGPDGLGYCPATPDHLTDWGGNATRLNNDINAGAYMVLHRDHGGETGWGHPAYDNGDLDGLHNDMYPFVFSINCLTGKYNWSGECFTEKFHRIEHGALGVIAASELSYSFVNDTFVWGMMDGLWHEFDPGYGPNNIGHDRMRTAFAQSYGKLYLQASSWPSNPGSKTVTYHLFHHHGDAFLTMYSEMPQDLMVIHEEILFTDLDYFTIQADEGSVIALTVDGEIIGVADATGSPQDIEIVPQVEPGALRITITKANYYRYDRQIPIIPPEGPYIVSGDKIIDDDLEGDSAGNGDGNCDAGETIELVLGLRNVGTETATNVRATLTAEDGYIQITDEFEEYGDILPDEQVFCAEAFVFTIDPTCPDGHEIIFTVVIESDDRLIWEKRFTLPVEAPIIGLVSYEIDDSVGGNGNGRVEPGETFTLTPLLGNTGHKPRGLSAHLLALCDHPQR